MISILFLEALKPKSLPFEHLGWVKTFCSCQILDVPSWPRLGARGQLLNTRKVSNGCTSMSHWYMKHDSMAHLPRAV